MSESGPRVLLSGYYGFGNLGDEALLALIVANLRRVFPGVDIEVLTATPAETSRDYDVIGTARGDLVSVKRSIDRADLVLSGGGGLLQNATSLKSLLYYAGLLHIAIRMQKRTMIFAQSVGPLDRIGRKTVTETCRHVDIATVRDERSEKLLRELLPMTRIEHTADPVFLWEPSGSVEPSLMVGLDASDGELALISVRKSARSEAVAERVARAVDYLASAHKIRSVFLPLGGVADAEVSTLIMRRCESAPLLLPSCDLATAGAIFMRCRYVIGMRLHALVLAARLGLPFLALSYDPKVAALCEDLEYPLPLLWDAEPGSVDPDIEPLIDRLIAERETLASGLTVSSARMRDAAERNFSLAAELLR